MSSTDWRGIYIGDKRPRRPWDVRFRQWLLKPSTACWLAPVLACVLVVALFALFIGTEIVGGLK